MQTQVQQLAGDARVQAPVVHRGRVVERRRLQLPQPGQHRGPDHDLAEGARHPGVELLLRRGRPGATTVCRSPSSRPTSTDDYVKPAALATMATSTEFAARPYRRPCRRPASPRPMRPPSAPPGRERPQLAAVWSDGLATTGAVTVTAPGGGTVPVTVTDEYGNATERLGHLGHRLQPAHLRPGHLPHLSGGRHPHHRPPPSPTGPTWPPASAGATATASLGNASAAIAGLPPATAGWYSSNGDTTPSLTVTLAGPGHHQPDRRRHPVGREHGHQRAQLHRLGRRARSTAGPRSPP